MTIDFQARNFPLSNALSSRCRLQERHLLEEWVIPES